MCSDFIRLKSYDFFRMFEVNPRKKQPFPQNEAHLQDKKKKRSGYLMIKDTLRDFFVL